MVLNIVLENNNVIVIIIIAVHKITRLYEHQCKVQRAITIAVNKTHKKQFVESEPLCCWFWFSHLWAQSVLHFVTSCLHLLSRTGRRMVSLVFSILLTLCRNTITAVLLCLVFRNVIEPFKRGRPRKELLRLSRFTVAIYICFGLFIRSI